MSVAPALEIEVTDTRSTTGSAVTRSKRLRSAVENHLDFLGRSLRRLGVAEPAVEDAAQQALMVLARRIDDVPEGKEQAFLFGTALRVASDYRKKQHRSLELSDSEGLDAHASPDLSPEQLLDGARARALLDLVLDEMPFELRSIFILYELEGMTMAAIADMVDLPPGTVASRLRRARTTFEATVSRLRREGKSR
jgi:RNA polymerase sigma-70 factor (ECF subfamily)